MRSQMKLAVAATLCTALVVGVGCKKDSQGPAIEKAALKSDVGTVAFAEDILAFGGVKSLDDFTSTMTALVSKFEPQMGAMIGAQVPALLQGQVLGVKNLAWMDHSKPVKFVLLNYKKFADPLLVLLPIKAKDAFTAALPENKTEGAPDNQTKYTMAAGNMNYVNVLGDWAVFSPGDKTFAAARSFLEGDFKDYVFTKLLDVQVSSTRLLAVAGDDIAAFKNTMANMPATPGLEIPGIQEMLKKEIEMFVDLLDQTETTRILMQYDGNNLDLRGSVKVVPGKGLAKFVAGTKERKLELYKSLPAGGWFAGAVTVDPKLFEDWANMGVDFWAGMLKLEPAEQEKLRELMSQLLALETGDSAFWLGYDGEFPFRFLSLTGITDPAKAKKALYETYGILLAKAGTLIESMAGPEAEGLPKMDWSSPTALLASLKPELDKSGVTAAITAKKVGDVDVDALEIGVDYSKLPIPAGDEDMKVITDAFGNKVSGALGFGKSLMYGTFGKDAVADIGMIAKGQGGGGVLKELIEKADTRVAGAMWFGLRDILKFLARIDADIAEGMPDLESFADPLGITIVIGGRGDRIVDASLGLPITQFSKLMPGPEAATPGAVPVTP